VLVLLLTCLFYTAVAPTKQPTSQPTTQPTTLQDGQTLAPTYPAQQASIAVTINSLISLSWVVWPRVSDPVNFTLTYAGLGWLSLGVYKGVGNHMTGGTGLVAVVGAGAGGAVVAKQLSGMNTAEITTVADSMAGLVAGSASLLQSAGMSLA
jgi:hypothetical protein